MTVAYQHVHSRVPAPSVAGQGHPDRDRRAGASRATDSDPTGRPLDAGAFLAEIADVRIDLGAAGGRGAAPPGRSDAETTQRLARRAGRQRSARAIAGAAPTSAGSAAGAGRPARPPPRHTAPAGGRPPATRHRRPAAGHPAPAAGRRAGRSGHRPSGRRRARRRGPLVVW